MLPNVDAQQRRIAVHQGAVLVGGAFDDELLVLVDAEPSPTAAETAGGRSAEVRLECIETAELRGDRLGQLAARLAALAGANRRPKLRVIGVSAAVVANRGPNVLGDLVDVLEQLFDWPIVPLGPFDGLVQIRHISLVMLIVMDFHRLGVDVRLKGIIGVGQGG